MRVETKGVLLEEDDIIPCFPLGIYVESNVYYIYRKHIPCVFPPIRSIVTFTSETSSDGVCVIGYGFIIHLQWED